jgi:hypothetical protein
MNVQENVLNEMLASMALAMHRDGVAGFAQESAENLDVMIKSYMADYIKRQNKISIAYLTNPEARTALLSATLAELR